MSTRSFPDIYTVDAKSDLNVLHEVCCDSACRPSSTIGCCITKSTGANDSVSDPERKLSPELVNSSAGKSGKAAIQNAYFQPFWARTKHLLSNHSCDHMSLLSG